jgi:hypothetical protein
LGVKQLRCEAAHSFLSSTGVKNDRSYTPTSLYAFRACAEAILFYLTNNCYSGDSSDFGVEVVRILGLSVYGYAWKNQ